MAESGNRSSRRATWLIGIVALAMSLFSVTLVHQYGATRPTVMEPGRIHAVKIHARTVYLTGSEYVIAFVSHAITVIAIGVFLGVLIKSRRQTPAPKT